MSEREIKENCCFIIRQMEYRRRTFSNVLDDEFPDIEKQIPRRRATSASIDETLDEYTEYVYNGTFSIFNSICCGFIKLICPCCYRKKAPITVSE
jgi:hypothetical protein